MVCGVQAGTSIYSSVLPAGSTKSRVRGKLENTHFTSRAAVTIWTGGIANEADDVEPHDAPNRAGRLTRSSELHKFFHWAGWGAHAEARMQHVPHAEWSALAF